MAQTQGQEARQIGLGAADTMPKRGRPVPGKGHRKSRNGCITCKTRRVKCSEELPNCRACRRLGLDCRYTQPASPPPYEPSGALRTTPSTLVFEDLRFFHHFLTAGHPPLPFGEAKVWQDVAAISHEVATPMAAFLGTEFVR